jgi:hypothetical protein
LTRLFEQIQGFGSLLEIHYHGFELGMTKFAGSGGEVGADIDMHGHFSHKLAQSIDGLNVATYQQDANPYRRG